MGLKNGLYIYIMRQFSEVCRENRRGRLCRRRRHAEDLRADNAAQCRASHGDCVPVLIRMAVDRYLLLQPVLINTTVLAKTAANVSNQIAKDIPGRGCRNISAPGNKLDVYKHGEPAGHTAAGGTVHVRAEALRGEHRADRDRRMIYGDMCRDAFC